MDADAELVKSIKAAKRRYDKATTEEQNARALLNETIRTALHAGVSTAEIMKHTGLSRARVYQIRDRRR